jgi:hypothetical protein
VFKQKYRNPAAAMPAILSRRIRLRLTYNSTDADAVEVIRDQGGNEVVILNNAKFIYDGELGGPRSGRMLTTTVGQFDGHGVMLSFDPRRFDMLGR